ncbi:hypothetical protein ACFLQX_01085 [Bacteroidota bacterium]
MKRLISFIFPLLFVFNTACEFEPAEIQCYPQRVKTTSSGGGGAVSITADYKYTGKLVDRIIWSNFQTHYFSYDAENQLTKVEEFNDKTREKTEYKISYDGYQLSRIDKYLSALDYTTKEPLDTTYIGYQTFQHDGANISEEEVYSREDESQEFSLSYKKEYSYDMSGNIIKLVSMDVLSNDTAEAYTYSYDIFKNPFKALKLYFNGETFVNNVLEKVDLVSDETYTYQVLYNANNYPDQINIKEEGTLYQVITYEYTCE